MSAQQIWTVWRRVLSDDTWTQAVLAGTTAALDATPEEHAILADYAATPAATKMTIDMFRNRTLAVARSSLGAVAPLTKRLFDQLPDPRREQLTAAFTRSIGYRDDGPNFCATARDFLRMLATELDAPGAISLVVLELATVALYLRLGADRTWTAPPNGDPDFDAVEGDTLAAYDAWALQQRGNAAAAWVRHDLDGWLEDPSTIGRTEPPAQPTFYMASLADATAKVAYASVSERAFAIFNLLAQPLRPTEVAARVPELAEDDVLSILADLLDLGVIRAVRP